MPGDDTQQECEQIVRRNVRRLRLEREMSQYELALSAGLTRAYIGRIESRGQNLKLSTLATLADVLGVEPWELLRPVES